ncbi:MAG: PEP-CTERM sorting domain-containing protein [Verrucomicrobiales bacterium]|nr:PEP-CTERM sorting domain-containing protein [Verrucomicrobiales bacterium]
MRLLACVILLAAPAQAQLLIEGTMSGSPAYGGSNPVSFEFSCLFDDSALVGSGSESFVDQPLATFTLSPNPFGSTSFNLANTGVSLGFTDGVLDSVAVGGLLNGVIPVIGTTDDFVGQFFDFGAGLQPYSLTASVATQSGTATVYFPSGNMTVTPVPEPHVYSLLAGLGVLGFAAFRRRRS